MWKQVKPMEIEEKPLISKSKYDETNARFKDVYYSPNQNVGKWLLYYPKEEIDDAWYKIRKIWNTLPPPLYGVGFIRCSTKLGCEGRDDGMIMFYTSRADKEDFVIKVGQDILNFMEYTHRPHIYYKTTNENKDYVSQHIHITYSLQNPSYVVPQSKCMFKK